MPSAGWPPKSLASPPRLVVVCYVLGVSRKGLYNVRKMSQGHFPNIFLYVFISFLTYLLFTIIAFTSFTLYKVGSITLLIRA